MSDFIPAFKSIDLSAPWLMPYLGIHQAFNQDLPTGELADWLNSYFKDHAIKPTLHNSDKPLTFVNQDDLPHGTAYEAHIHATANIPTRNNLHDWFGACVWSAFPKSKSVLNHVHIREMAKGANEHNGRNRVRDAITVFDENGAILMVKDRDIGRALQNFDWQNTLVKPRNQWHNPALPSADDAAQIFIFGHALLEQLIHPRKPLCSHAFILSVDDEFFELGLVDKLAYVDEVLAIRLDQWLIDGATPRDLSPLPILGVPYFWDNEGASFYDDANVFRSGRRV